MIKDYLVKYRYLRDVFKDNFELYSCKHNYDSLNRERYFDTPSAFYNLVIVEYFSTNHLLTSPHFDIVGLFTKFKQVKKIKHTLFDLLLDCDFELDPEYSKVDYHVEGIREDDLTSHAMQDFLIIYNYLYKNKIMPIEDIKELLTKIERNYKKNLGVKK